LGERLIDWRRPIVVVVAAITAVLGYRAAGLEMATRFDDLLPLHHPFIEVHRQYKNEYGGANTVMVMLEVSDGTIFRADTLRRIYEVTEALEQVPGISPGRIDSIGHGSTRYIRVTAGGTIETPPVMRAPPETAEEARAIERIVHENETLHGVLVSLDDRAALLRAYFVERSLDYGEIFSALEGIARRFSDGRHRVHVAGEPMLYGWIYRYSSEVWWIFGASLLAMWLLLFAYFRDWRGALRPTITGVVSALWGLGFMELAGFSLDPLALVIPFFVTARAVSHSVQMHDRYYEEFRRCGWQKRRAIVNSFAGLFRPTLAGIVTDALGMLVIFVVQVPILQAMAISASFWVMSVAVSELLLNPIVYFYLRPPQPVLVEAREHGIFRRTVDLVARLVTASPGRWVAIGVWGIALLLAATQWRQLIIGDPDAASPLLWTDSPYNRSHTRIQEKFGGIEPLIVIIEGEDADVLKDPAVHRTIEAFQRTLERDPEVGYSFSVTDIVRSMNAAIHDLHPRWGFLPRDWHEIGSLLFFFFSGSSPSEIQRFVDPAYRHSAITFYCRNHRGATVQRIVEEAREFIAANPMERARFRLAGGLVGVTAGANEEILTNDILMNLLSFGTIFLVVLFTYRAFGAAMLMMVSLVVANGLVNAYIGLKGFGINLQSLPVVTVGVGFGIDYGLYIVSRAVEEFRTTGRLEESVRRAVSTAGKAVSFTALALCAVTLLWAFSSVRFNSEMGILLAIWMAVSFASTVTLLPALLIVLRPRFLLREGPEEREARGERVGAEWVRPGSGI
ncbi:MAG: efflux RND transporter permease subunit, partial [Candidatus Binatia bacterium]